MTFDEILCEAKILHQAQKFVTLKIQHVYYDEAKYEPDDHHHVLSTIANSQPILVKKYEGGSDEDGLVNLWEVAMYEDHWKDFLFCKKSKQGKNKTKKDFLLFCV